MMNFSAVKRITAVFLACCVVCLGCAVSADTLPVVSGDPTGAAATAVFGKAADDKSLYLTVTSPSLYRTFYQVNPGGTYTNYRYLVYEANIAPVSGVKSVYLQTASSARVSALATEFDNNRWNHFMFVYEVPTADYANGRTTCYVNGEAVFTDAVNAGTFRGTDVRIALDSTVTQKIADRQDLYAYIDDINLYLTDDMPGAPEMPTADSAEDGVIEVAEEDTADSVYADADAVRIYRGGDFSQLLAADDKLKYGDTAVVEKNGKYAYFTIGIKGKRYLCSDGSGERFSHGGAQYASVSGVFGKAANDVSAKLTADSPVSVAAQTDMENGGARYDSLIFEMNFVPQSGFERISVTADSAEIDGTALDDGWVCGRWNNVRYVFALDDSKVYAYINGRAVSESGTDTAAVAAAQSAGVEAAFSGTAFADDFKVYYTSADGRVPTVPTVDSVRHDVRGDALVVGAQTKAENIAADCAEMRCYTDGTFSAAAPDGTALQSGNVLVLQSLGDVYNYYFVLTERGQAETKEMNVTLRYNPETNCLEINGSLASARREVINIEATPVTGGDVFRYGIKSDRDGNISDSIAFGTKFIGKKYSYTVNSDSEIKKGEFSATDSRSMANFLAGINAAANSSAIESELRVTAPLIALDNGDGGKDFAYMADLVFSMRPTGGYTADGMINAYMISEGMNYVKSGRLTFDKFLTDYGAYLDADYAAKYGALSSQVRSEMNTVYAHGIVFASFGDMFDDVTWLCGYRLQTAATAMGRYFLAYCADNGVSLAAYNSLANDYKREQVFAAMYPKRSEKYYISDVISEFNACTAANGDSTGGGNGGNSGNGGSGGSGGGSKVSMTQPTVPDNPNGSSESRIFSDTNGHWAADVIERMNVLGIVNGFEDGSFRPDETVTRAEFAKMMITALGKKITLTAAEGEVFADVQPQDWYYDYVKSASAERIVMGYDGRFAPNDAVTREDAAVMLYRCMQKLGEYTADGEPSYADADSISQYAHGAVAVLTQYGILTGDGNMFRPGDGMTRAEVAAMTARFIEMNF